MYNNNLLRATKADIPKIKSTDISANQINTINIGATNINTKNVNTNTINSRQINTDIINVKNQIIAQRFCDQNNICIDNAFLQRVNTTLANENVFFRNEMVVWNNLDEHVQKDIVSIPNDKNIAYAISIKKLNNETYILGINPDTTFEIQIPPVPENVSYEYTVLWLQVEQSDIQFNININEIEYFTPVDIGFFQHINFGEEYISNNQSVYTSSFYNQSQNYTNFIDPTINKNKNINNFIWIPYIIKNLNQSKKIKISIKSRDTNNILWLSSIAFSSNPLNLSMNNINVFSNILYGYNYYNNYTQVPSIEWHWESYTIQDFIRDKKIPSLYMVKSNIKIPYINTGKNKILTLLKTYGNNSYITVRIQTGIQTYELLQFTDLSNKPLNKFLDQQFIYILLDKTMLNYDKNHINLLIEHTYYNLYNPIYFSYGYNTYFQNTYSWWPNYRYIKYFYESYSGLTIIGTYDYLIV